MNATETHETFRQMCGPDAKIDLTLLPRVKSPSAAERATWRKSGANHA